ncbi:MFS transporter [Jeotgalibacillus terrae]|uniref:MFS transporter n=1 Tax=Jeotgalibacillus terrae TaxID=587735 RepID=A0ABW5ZK50_9BACL|nr:MFS transporter [Jeotgalibacillus terrae]MBM7581134.1 MFS family permease [Jeotgalibacillus terrae]
MISKKLPSVVYLWIGQGISSFATSIYTLALAWYVIELTSSPLQMGTLLFIAMIPRIILSFISGAIGDRVSKKKFIITIDLLRFTIAAIWSISLFSRPVSLTEIYIFTFIFSAMSSFYHPIYNSMIPDLLDKSNLKLTQAASINEMVFKISMITSPAISGLLVGFISFEQFILLNASGFLLAALFTSLIKHKGKAKLYDSNKSIIFDLKKGINYFVNNKIIFWSVILITFANIAVVSYNVNLANLIQHEMESTPSLYGLVLTLFSIGSFLGFLFLSIFKVENYRGYIYICSLLLAGISFVTVGVFLNPFSLMLTFFCIGLFFAVVSTISTTILFEVPSEDYRARIFGIASVSSLLSPLGYLLWGFVGESVSSSFAISSSGIIIIFVAIIGFFTSLSKFK